MLGTLFRRFCCIKAIPGRAKRYTASSTAARRGPHGEWKPPTYTGPHMIGVAITEPDEPIGPNWIGKAIPSHPAR